MMTLGTKITAPAELPNGRIMRGFARGIIGAIPFVGSLAAETAELLLPNPEASQRAEWEAEVSRLLNWLGSSVGVFQGPELNLTWLIGQLFWQIDVDAMGRISIEEPRIYQQFSEASDHEISEAIAELAQLNWCEGWDDPDTKSGYGGFYLKPLLFSYLDPNLRGNSPLDDAVHIASRLLEVAEDDISAKEIDQLLGWENRRLYPAMWLLSEHIVPPPFNEAQIEAYPIPAFYLSGNNRRSLRKFVRQN